MSQPQQVHILIVDDSQTIRNTIAKYLDDKYITHQASNGEEAWQLIETNPLISLIFADLNMPVMNGMALLKKIRNNSNKQISETPVIMITGHDDTEAAKRASYTMGASEFISKPFCEFDIVSRVDTCISLKQKISSLENKVIHDELTELYNSAGFHKLAEQSLAASFRHKYDLSILSLQIANLDQIQEKYGNKIASQIIIAVSKSLKKSLRKEESLAHLGKGHFAMLMPLTRVFRAQIVAQRFYKSISNLVFKIGNDELKLMLAFGINSTEDYDEAASFEDIMSDTESAMLQSLNSRPFKIVRYDASLGKMFSSTLTTSSEEIEKLAEIEKQRNESKKSASSGFQLHNTIAFSNYMSMILNGQFDKIPPQDRKILIKPLEAFLKYIDELEATEEKN